MSDLNKLKELAKKATPGKWNAFVSVKGGTCSVHTPDDSRKGDVINWPGFDTANCTEKQKAANARFIAAANPATVIGLIDRLEAAQHRIAELDVKLTRLTGDYKYLINQHMPRTDDGCDEGWSRVIEANELQAKLEAAEAELARRDAAAGEPVGEIRLSEYDDNGIRTATVHCLHDQADWENFTHGTKLFTAAQPPALPWHFDACSNCGSKNHSWDTTVIKNTRVQDGLLKLNETSGLFYLGCDECSETLLRVSADEVANHLNNAKANGFTVEGE